jgi:hypothetical protein
MSIGEKVAVTRITGRSARRCARAVRVVVKVQDGRRERLAALVAEIVVT